MARPKKQRGSAMLEFVLTGIPLIFIVISTVQMAIGMWHYHTLQYAVKQAGAYLGTHGSVAGYCGSNTCQIQNVAAILKTQAIGIPAESINVTFTPVSSVDHTTTGTAYSCRLDACVTDSTVWPITGYNNVGSEFEIKAYYQWFHALDMVAPGSVAAGPVRFANPYFPGYTHQIIMY